MNGVIGALAVSLTQTWLWVEGAHPPEQVPPALFGVGTSDSASHCSEMHAG